MDISLDTCAFFFMLKYNDAFSRSGMSGLDETLENDERKLVELEKKISSCMSDKFLSANKSKSFKEKLDLYKDYANSTMASALSKIEQYQKNLRGIFYDDKGREFYREPSPQQKEIFNRKIKLLEGLYSEVSRSYNEYLEVRRAYKAQQVRYEVGLIFKASLEGKYRLNLTPTAVEEIYNHAGDEDSKDEEGNVIFSFDKISSLMRRCTLRTTEQKEVIDQIDEIAAKFREKQGNETQNMAPDIDSLGKYGDSLIMAEANIFGLPLITDNRKDFIRDKKVKQDNDRIRRHIALVASQNYPYTTDTLPLSPSELLEGQFKVPTRVSVFQMPEPESGYDFAESY